MSILYTGYLFRLEPWQKDAFNWTAGFKTKATLPADLTAARRFAVGRVGAAGSHRGLRLHPFGQGADNAVFSFRVWGLRPIVPTNSLLEVSVGDGPWKMDLLGFGDATMGTGTGVAGSVLTADDRLCDAVNYTEATVGTTPQGAGAFLRKTANSVPSEVYSPGGNLWAELGIVDLAGVAEVAIEVQSAGASILGGFCVELW